MFEAIGPVATDEGSVGVVGRDFDVLGIDGALRVAIPKSMGAAKGDAGEEGLAFLALIPVGALEEFAFFIREKIAVGLPAHQASVVAVLGEEMRDGFDAVRERFFKIGPVLVRTDVVLMKARHHGRARGRADRRGGKGMGVADALRGELVDVRSVDSLGAVAGKIRAPVLDCDPEDVGFGGFDSGTSVKAGRE